MELIYGKNINLEISKKALTVILFQKQNKKKEEDSVKINFIKKLDMSVFGCLQYLSLEVWEPTFI